VLLPIPEHDTDDRVALTRAKICTACGYIHVLRDGAGPDRCERCEAQLPLALDRLFRLQNVSTRRHDKITCDEEERLRLGYVLRTGLRFAQHDGTLACRTAELRSADGPLARLAYGPAATVWRMNLGWRRSQQRDGFDLDIERGRWGQNPNDPDDNDAGGLGPLTRRVIPYVEDRRNCLVVAAADNRDPRVMASLQAALKTAIQIAFQLEESELAAEPLPDSDHRRLILFYESAEGGAGALRRLVEDPAALPAVARAAVELCHFDPDTGQDLGRHPRAREACEAACYHCLMSYSNQLDHRELDRQAIVPFLRQLAGAQVIVSPTAQPRADALTRLLALCQSNLERQWLQAVAGAGLRLPSDAQRLMPECGTRPDFLYEAQFTVVYVDGPHHAYPERQARDRAQQTALEDRGWTVLRFGAAEAWTPLFAAHPGTFGLGRAGTPA